MDDPAILGAMRIGHARLGVLIPTFDLIAEQHARVPAQTLGGITPCLQGVARQGMTRHRVYRPIFDETVKQFEKAT